MSLLNTWRGEQWTSCQSISTVLLTLCTLLCNEPLLNEPGVTSSHCDITPYNEIIQFANLDIAVCDIITKKNGIYLPFFDNFYPFIKENFGKNYQKMVEFAENKLVTDYKESKILKTSYYSMCVNVNYKKIIEKLGAAKLFIENV